MLVPQPCFEKFEIAEHAGEKVIKIVRHAPGKLANQEGAVPLVEFIHRRALAAFRRG